MAEVSVSRRDRMLQAAEEVLNAAPFGAELMPARVAERAEVDPSTLWRTFGRGDEGIIRALAARRAEELWQHTTPRVAEGRSAYLARALRATMDTWREHGRMWAAVMRLTISKTSFAQWWYDEVMVRWSPLLAEAVAGPDAEPDRKLQVERQVALYLNGAYLAFHNTARRAAQLRSEGDETSAWALEEQTLADVVLLGRNAFGLELREPRSDFS